MIESKALILSKIPYQDQSCIMHVFTRELGRLPLFLEGKDLDFLEPFVLIEGEFTQGREEFHALHFPEYVAQFASNRSLETLKVFTQLQSFLLSLPVCYEDPLLFDLLLVYLQHLTTTDKPQNALLSFFLKVLKHQGKLHAQHIPKQFHPLLDVKSTQKLEALHEGVPEHFLNQIILLAKE